MRVVFSLFVMLSLISCSSGGQGVEMGTLVSSISKLGGDEESKMPFNKKLFSSLYGYKVDKHFSFKKVSDVCASHSGDGAEGYVVFHPNGLALTYLSDEKVYNEPLNFSFGSYYIPVSFKNSAAYFYDGKSYIDLPSSNLPLFPLKVSKKCGVAYFNVGDGFIIPMNSGVDWSSGVVDYYTRVNGIGGVYKYRVSD